MPVATDPERLRRALAPVAAVLLGLGLLAAVSYETRSGADDPGRADLSEGTPTPSPSAPIDPAGSPTPDPADPAASTTTVDPQPLGPAAVPAAGTYRYDIDEVRDGETATRVEEREVTIVGEEGSTSVVQITARSDGERQVSVLGWSADGVFVRSTRIETDDGSTRDCAWDPAFTEFGVLAEGAAWTVDSTCTTEVAGLPTVFVVSGTGRVVGAAEVVHAGAPVRVWQVVRDRTTTITATVGNDDVEQIVNEVGTFFIDPARGLALRSDVTVTLSGTQTGETRRTSVLTDG